MKKVLTSVICGLVGINTLIASDNGKPRLVVGITVDQLRTDYIEYLMDLFGEKGFRRLVKDGAFFRDVDYNVSGLDAASGTAMIVTGAYPRYNGITSSKVYSPESKDMVAALNDPGSIGNFTSETYSPVNLRLSTLSDEIAVAGNGKAKIYSLSPDAQQAIIMAGHAGNSAFWINENTGNWATTTYYQDNPALLTQRNYSNPVTARLDTMKWVPSRLLPSDNSSTKGKDEPFRHTFPRADRNVYRMFASSPMANTEITDVAISYLYDLGLGRNNDATDMLNIAYTAAPYKYDGDNDFRPELEDTYFRLDGDLGRLFDAIDKTVGLDKTLVYLTSTGYFDDSTQDDARYRIPSGTFSVKRALSLLNSYLSAHYGNGSYVDTYSRGHIYLDRKEIEEKGLKLHDVAELSRDFLVRMSGVNDAFTMSDIMSSSLPSMEGLRLGTDPKTGGDIVLEFNPGWNIVDDTRFPNEITPLRASAALFPAFIMGPQVEAGVEGGSIDAVSIAPTVSQILRIRSPNGSVAKPVNISSKANK